jgi:nitroreductase
MKKYDPMVTPWQIKGHDFPREGAPTEKLLFLLRYAILAPSSHNIQPGKFSVGEDEIQIFVEKTRWLKVADPDQRELYISVGCALENLLIAAEHFGYGHQVAYFPEPANEELAAVVKFMPHGEPSTFREPALFEAISSRHTNRKFYEERPIPQSDLQHLQNHCVEEGIWLHMTDELEIKRKADELIIRGDAIQFSDPAFREELGYWIGQGLLCTPWLMSKMAQVKVGQVFERVCLAATMLGISVHPMSQILQIPELKTGVGKLIPKSDIFPQHTFRLGYAEQEKGHTPRRQLDEVLVERM